MKKNITGKEKRAAELKIGCYERVMLVLSGATFVTLAAILFSMTKAETFTNADSLLLITFLLVGSILVYSGYKKSSWFYMYAQSGIVGIVATLGLAIIATGSMIAWVGEIGLICGLAILLLKSAALPLAIRMSTFSIYDHELTTEK
jgi:hypothetical protein